MEVQLSADQKAILRKAIESGRVNSEEEAVRQALSLWEERERRRAQILADVDAAETSLARGEGREITSDSVKELSRKIKQRGRARLKS